MCGFSITGDQRKVEKAWNALPNRHNPGIGASGMEIRKARRRRQAGRCQDVYCPLAKASLGLLSRN